jgi:urea transport system ATP-binding protein
MSAVGEPILSLRAVSKRYGGLQAVDSVSLDVMPGRLHSIVGPNGAGKSTLFNCICGVDRADSGTIEFRGTRIERLPAWRIARLGIARKFQAPSVFPELTVAENVQVAATGRQSWFQLARRVRHARQQEFVESTLSDMELAHCADLLPQTLPHGEQQRLELAMVLATEPALMLLDEPTAGLSADETEATARMLRRLTERVPTLVVEHDLAFIRQVSDWITVMDRGRLLAEGEVDEIAADERVREAYLGRQKL